MENLILTATDFTETGNNATRYACQLAQDTHAGITVIHAYIIPVMFNDLPIPSPAISEAKNDTEAHMERLVGDLRAAYPGLSITGRVLYGDIVEALEDYAEQHTHPMLIVMGNGNNSDSWPDSIVADSFRKLKYPVLAVPSGVAYTAPKKLALAYDNKHTGNDIAFNSLVSVVQHTGCALQVINVQADGHSQDNNTDIDDAARQMLSPVSPLYHILYGQEDTEAALTRFIAGEGIDWLAVIPRRHSFFEGLFHKSLTSAITHHMRMPILGLHDGQ